MPGHQRLGGPEHARFRGRHEAAGGDRAQVDELQVVAAGDDQHAAIEKAVAVVGLFLHRLVGKQRREHRRAARKQAEQRLHARAAERVDFLHRQERLQRALVLAEHRHVAGDEDRAGVRPRAQGGYVRFVVPPVGNAVERVVDEAETIVSHTKIRNLRAAHG